MLKVTQRGAVKLEFKVRSVTLQTSVSFLFLPQVTVLEPEGHRGHAAWYLVPGNWNIVKWVGERSFGDRLDRALWLIRCEGQGSRSPGPAPGLRPGDHVGREGIPLWKSGRASYEFGYVCGAVAVCPDLR